MATLESALEDVRSLYPRLAEGDMALIGVFADKATVDSPLGGKQQPAEFIAETRAWLARHEARSVQVHDVITPERIVHELLLLLTFDGEERELPVMLVADLQDGRIRDLRVYHSTWPLTGSHLVRPPIMQYDLVERPPEPVGSYHEALAHGDAEAADAAFEPDGCVREPAGGQWVHCGQARADWYVYILRAGPIVLHLGTISDDGTTVVYEYMADAWGEPMTPQAGAAAYQRGASGKLLAARIYDDIEPPAALGSALGNA
jgi:hypothetical protein